MGSLRLIDELLARAHVLGADRHGVVPVEATAAGDRVGIDLRA